MTGPFAPHVLRDSPSQGSDPNLSDFTCTCGETFIANGIEPRPPYGAPSLGYAHKVIVAKQAAGHGPSTVIVDSADLEALPETAIVADATGRLSRRWHRPHMAWKHADGSVSSRLDDVATPVSVWWVPGEDITV